jgi:hypothetical protein
MCFTQDLQFLSVEIALILDNVCHISELLLYNMRIGDIVYTLLIMNVLYVVQSVSNHEMTLLLLA